MLLSTDSTEKSFLKYYNNPIVWKNNIWVLELQKALKATGYKYFIRCIFILNKESSVISVLNNMKIIKRFFK